MQHSLILFLQRSVVARLIFYETLKGDGKNFEYVYFFCLTVIFSFILFVYVFGESVNKKNLPVS